DAHDDLLSNFVELHPGRNASKRYASKKRPLSQKIQHKRPISENPRPSYVALFISSRGFSAIYFNVFCGQVFCTAREALG
ncbi:MAG TPA: hypothetical protein VIE90_19135, partial [Candidatus Binatia bacterium]